MELILSLLVGLVVGAFITIPLGPIAVYAIRRALEGEVKRGVMVGVGSVTVDVFYCLLITMGLMSLLDDVLQNIYVQLTLATFVLAYGIKMLVVDRKRRKAEESDDDDETEEQKQRFTRKRYSVILGMTMAIANPSIIISYTAIIGFVFANGWLGPTIAEKVVFSVATGIGSLVCFTAMLFLVRSKRHLVPKNIIRTAGTVAAIAIMGFGIYFAYVVVHRLMNGV